MLNKATKFEFSLFSCEGPIHYGVPLRSKYPDSEILFQKQKISRDVQNMMPKIITYRSRPKKKVIDSEIFDRKVNSKSIIFDDVTN